jgi:hypothetical protein
MRVPLMQGPSIPVRQDPAVNDQRFAAPQRGRRPSRYSAARSVRRVDHGNCQILCCSCGVVAVTNAVAVADHDASGDEPASGPRARLYRDGVCLSQDFAVADISEHLAEAGSVVWLDLCRPTPEDFALASAPMREVLNSLLSRDLSIVDDAMTPYYQDVYDHVLRATEWTESLHDLVATTVETNLIIQDNRMDLIMKKVTSPRRSPASTAGTCPIPGPRPGGELWPRWASS